MLTVDRAEYLGEYKLNVTFSDGRAGDVDLRPVLRQDNRRVFRELTELDRFAAFSVEQGAVSWENGLDLAPEYLYFLAFCHEPDLQHQFRAWGYLQSESLAER